MLILAIDPGTKHSAYVTMDEEYRAIGHAKVDNGKLLELITLGRYDVMAIECMESRLAKSRSNDKAPNQVIGWETYETCYWIGRFMEAAIRRGTDVYRVYRTEEKSRIIPTKKNKLPPLPPPASKTTDAKIRRGLIMRFAQFDKKNGKGKANCKDVFYGFKADEWSAFAVGAVYLDKLREAGLKGRLNA